jgi:hypothetical protein
MSLNHCVYNAVRNACLHLKCHNFIEAYYNPKTIRNYKWIITEHNTVAVWNL